MSITKQQIISIAKDKFNHQCFPTLSGYRSVEKRRAFRVPDDRQPLGFDYHGVSMEVHVTHMKNVLIGGTSSFRHIPILLILGLRSDGILRVIAEGVQAHD